MEEGAAKKPRISQDLVSAELFTTPFNPDSVSLLAPLPRKPLFNRGEENVTLATAEPAATVVASVAAVTASVSAVGLKSDGNKKKNDSKEFALQRAELQKKALKMVNKK